MKLNNSKNVINDSDVTLTGGKNIGRSLSDVLTSQQNEIDQLKGNVKWVYKYGGVGSGGSGGGGATGKLTATATLNGTPILAGNTIQLSESVTSYTLSISATGGGNYAAYVTYGENAERNAVISLTSENVWRASYILTDIKTNGKINVEVTDGVGGSVFLNAIYAVKPFEIGSLDIIKDSNDLYIPTDGNTYIDMTTANRDGLLLSCKYKVSIPGKLQYYWEIPEGAHDPLQSLGTREKPNNAIEKDGILKYKFPTEFLVDGNAGDYDAAFYYRTVPDDGEASEWMSKSVTFCIFPEGLYLSVIPSEPKSVYDSPTEYQYLTFSVSQELIGGLDGAACWTSGPIYVNSGDAISFPGSSDFKIGIVSGKINTSTSTITVTEILCEETNLQSYYKSSTADTVFFYTTTKQISENLTYQRINVENIYNYSVNRTITMYARIFTGAAVTGISDGKIEYSLDNSGTWYSIDNLTDGRSYSIPKIVFTSSGWHYIYFRYSFSGISGTPISKYVYVTETDSSLNWFKKNSQVPATQKNFYRFNLPSSTFSDISPTKPTTQPNYNEISATDDTKWKIKVDNHSTSSIYDFVIHVGIQYSELNVDSSKDSSTSEPIITFYRKYGNVENPIIKVYQDGLIYNVNETASVDLFLPKTDSEDYKPDNTKNYHLLTINYRTQPNPDGVTGVFRELSVYVDGVLEGVLNDWKQFTTDISSIEFGKFNAAINLLEVDFVNNKLNNNPYFLTDADILYYYYTYWVKSNNDNTLISAEKIKVLNTFFNLNNIANYNIKDDILHIDEATYQTLVSEWSDIESTKRSGTKVLLLKTSRFNSNLSAGVEKDIITEWMNGSYEENTETGEVTADEASWKVPVELEWGQLGGGMADPLNGYTMQYEGSNREVSSLVDFTIKLQGSSTMRYKAKNFTLGMTWKSGLDITSTPIFSPNFLLGDTSTFLPETAYTLKADVVDSSHSNNTSIGEFVNAVESGKLGAYWKVDNMGMVQSGKYAGHVKKCLDGFPVILILNATTKDGANDYYYLGVYNFNLGRQSYYNLGYCDLSTLGNLPESTTNSFSFTTVDGINIFDNFVAAEIQGNTKFWDFSQYQNSVLFSTYANDNSKYMFDDFVHSAKNGGYQSSIRAFVKSIAKAGGYIFTSLGKTFDDIGENPGDNSKFYHVPDHVPDYTIQYKRSAVQTWEHGYDTQSDADSLIATEGDLKDCIDEYEDAAGMVNTPYLNYNSALYYYVICMAFGLVDSVQKNLNIKTWNNKTFGIYFYDMDTCLGIDNGGAFTSYFCFSDYWKTEVDEAQTKEVIVDGEKTTVTYYPINARNCKVWRDYYPEKPEVTGFDIPSSYLYSLPKYASIFNSALKSPATLWGEWRSAANTAYPNAGPLVNADRFIENYYAYHLSGIPEILVNLNYRNKYLAKKLVDKTGTQVSFDSTSKILHGRGIHRTKEWLKARLHVLDAYFNLNSSPVEIYNGLQEPMPQGGNYKTNSDVYVYGEIFRASNETTMKRSGNLDFIVKARDYSPFIIQEGSAYHRFFLSDADTYYGIRFGYSGSVNASLGGSNLWTYVDSLNTFIGTMQDGSKFYLNSDLLTNLIGNNTDSGGFSGATIVAPNAKTITLSSRNYSGGLDIDSSYTNLTDFDISGSQISAIIRDNENKEIGIRKLNLSNITSTDIEIANCPHLDPNYVNLTNAAIQNCKINSLWKKDLDFSNTKIVSLNITNPSDNWVDDATLTYSGNANIKSIGFSGFKTVYITNCPNLTTITTSDIDNSVLTSLTVTNCTNLETVTLGAKYTSNLKTLNFDSCSKLDKLILNSESNFSGLSTLNLNNTKISTIEWIGNNKPTPTDDNTILNLKPFTSFSLNWKSGNTLTLTNMTKVRFIQFTNEKTKPVILTTNFTGCSELEKVYGNIVMTASSAFSGLNKFSIHGDLEGLNWRRHTDLLDGARIKPVWEILKTECEAVNNYDLGWAPPAEQSKLVNACYATGDKVTNIRFTTLSNALANTNYTLLDVYYALSLAFTTATTYDNGYKSGITTEAGSCFYKSNTQGNKKYGMFFYNYENTVPATDSWPEIPKGDNSPNRYMFYYNGNFTNINNIFDDHSGAVGHSKYYSYVKLYSPSNANGNVIGNDGLFSPLTKVNFVAVFYPRYPIFDRFLFRRASVGGNLINFACTSMTYVNSWILVDDINNMETPPSSNITELKNLIQNNLVGNADRFFENLPNLSSMYICFNSMPYFNFNTLKLPSGITSVDNCFRASYGTGSVNPRDIFTAKTNGNYVVQNITKSFVVSTTSPLPNTFEDATLNINNDTFKGFTSLAYVGYKYTGDTRGSWEGDVSYIGSGLKKTITTDTFPYELLKPCRNTIVQFAGFFQNVKADSFSTSYKPALPGNLFQGCSELTDIGALFYMSDFSFTLSPTKYSDQDDSPDRYFNFRQCPKIEKCGYLFTDTTTEHTPNNPAKLTGSIPYKFFWHGETMNTVQEKIGLWLEESGEIEEDTGKPKYYFYQYPDWEEFNKVPEERTIIHYPSTMTIDNFLTNVFLQSFIKWETEEKPEGNNLFVLTQGEFTYPSPLNTITSLSHCFEGADLSYYEAEYDQGSNTEYNRFAIERNPDYNFVSHTYTITDTRDLYVLWQGKYYLPSDVIYNEDGEIIGVVEGAQEQQIYVPSLIKNNKFNPKKWNFMWSYDGNCSHMPPQEEYLKDGYCSYDVDADDNEILITNSGTYRSYACNDVNTDYCTADFGMVPNFMCPPDLLRYCVNSNSLDLNNLFAYGGVLSWGTSYGSQVNLFDYGNTGRICPYLLKPVGNVTNLKYMFAYNRRLSGYAVYDSASAQYPNKSYIIPQTFFKHLTGTNQVNIDYMFEYILIPGYCDLDVFKYMSTKSLTLFGIFYTCYWGAENEAARIIVDGIFNKFNVTGTKYAFSLFNSIYTTSPFPHAVYVTFNNVFGNYSGASYLNNNNFTWTFANYIHKSGGVTYYIEEQNKTVPINRSSDKKTDQRKNYELFDSAAYED